MAPRRDDAYRRTMGYETVEQAIRDAGVAGIVSTKHANAESEVQPGSIVHVKAGDHVVRTKLHVTRNLTVMSEDDAETVACVVTAEEVSLLVADAQEVVIDRLTLKQSGGDGTDDYWDDGLHVVKVRLASPNPPTCAESRLPGRPALALAAVRRGTAPTARADAERWARREDRWCRARARCATASWSRSAARGWW